VKSLLDHGANPKIKNRDWKSAEDYIVEDERFRSSPVRGGNGANGDNKAYAPAPSPPVIYNSEAANLTGGRSLSDITTHLKSLARSFESEYQGKDRDILQAKALLTQMHAEVAESSKMISALSEQTVPLEGQRRELETLLASLQQKMEEAMNKGYETWEAGQESRIAAWSRGEPGEYGDLEEEGAMPEGGPEAVKAEEDRLRWEIEEKRRKRKEVMSRLVTATAEAGTGDKIAKYRKLVAAGCGGKVDPSQLDDVMTQFLEVSSLFVERLAAKLT
jgi:hypothetical protein